jgi:hypothetical protein
VLQCSALEVAVNGSPLCTACLKDGELRLGATVNAIRGEQPDELHALLSVSGQTNREASGWVIWAERFLNRSDEVQIHLVDRDAGDEPTPAVPDVS